MQTQRATTVVGTFVAVLMVLGVLSTSRHPGASSAVHAQTSWRGLVVAPERRCALYEADEYRYSQSVEGPDRRRVGRDLRSVYRPLVRHEVGDGHRAHGRAV